MSLKTPLYTRHEAAGAKFVDFSGWQMPIHYGSQVEEHHTVRQLAGVFDVSHMVVVDICGNDAKLFLQYLLANDVDKLTAVGRALYTPMLNQEGGVVDDLIVYRTEGGYRLVVNAGTATKDIAWMQTHSDAFDVDVIPKPELCILAVQGPNALSAINNVLPEITADLAALKPFQGMPLENDGYIAKTGYTGEAGVEIILSADHAIEVWDDLMREGVKPIGLGARDTLRLEAGMNLYGQDMDESTSPLISNLGWTIAWAPEDRVFIGRDVITQEKADGIQYKLVGLVLEEKGVLRHGQTVIIEGEEAEGVVTSGSFSPTLGVSIALARVPVSVKTEAVVQVRKKQLRVTIVKPSFVRNGKSLL